MVEFTDDAVRLGPHGRIESLVSDPIERRFGHIPGLLHRPAVVMDQGFVDLDLKRTPVVAPLGIYVTGLMVQTQCPVEIPFLAVQAPAHDEQRGIACQADGIDRIQPARQRDQSPFPVGGLHVPLEDPYRFLLRR